MLDYDDDTLCARKNYDLAFIIAKKGTRVDFGFGHTEGFHRAGSSIQAMTGSGIDCVTGVIEGPCNLTYQNFVDAGVIKKKSFDADANFQEIVETALIGKCMFFDETSNVEVKWISTAIEDIPASVVLDAFKEFSKQTSDNKYQSVRKNSFVIIGNMGRTALHDLDEKHYVHRPNTSKAARFVKTKFQSATDAKKSLAIAKETILKSIDNEKMNVEQIAFEWYPYMKTEEYRAYCKAPFREEHRSNVIRHFTFPSIDDARVALSPPFLNSYKSLLFDPKEISQLTTWSMNAIYFIPRIIHLLFAQKEDRPLDEMANNQACYEFALYTARYHSNTFGMSNGQCHGVMASDLYVKLSHTPSTCVSPNDIISAALLIVDTFNVALTHPDEWSVSDSKLQKRKVVAKLEDAGNMLDTIYSTIQTRDKIVKMQDILRNLGE